MHNFKKKFGQNFLKTDKFPKILFNSVKHSKEITYIEVGPGDGAVTKNFLSAGLNVIGIEVDYDLIPKLLRRFFEVKNFDLINQSILDLDFAKEFKQRNVSKNIVVYGSLPYNISKKIIEILMEFSARSEYTISEMSFIVQEEVAKDYCTKAPKGSFLGAISELQYGVRKLQSIPAREFFPTPKVNGGILHFTNKNTTKKLSVITKTEDGLMDLEVCQMSLEKLAEVKHLINIAFSSPRKTLYNNLRNSGKFEQERLKSIFTEFGINESARASEVPYNLWGEINEFLILQA